MFCWHVADGGAAGCGRAGVAWQVVHDKLQLLATEIHSRAGEAALTRSEAALASGICMCLEWGSGKSGEKRTSYITNAVLDL